MNLGQKRVLVTGADGFIGSHLTEALVARGCAVRALVFYNSFNTWGWLDHTPAATMRAVEVVAGDIRDPHAVSDFVSGCDVVLHLAALIAIPYSYRSPDSYVETNIKGTLNVLQASRHCGTERVIHMSTSEVYGTAAFVPITEEHPVQGQSPYSASKIAAEQMAVAFHRSYGTPVTIVRPFNTYGPRQSARAVIPTIITQIAGGNRTIKLGSRHPTRDFNFISDTIRGLIAIAESQSVTGEVVNLGGSIEVSIGETATMIAALMDADVTLEVDAQRVRVPGSEVDRLYADASKARRLTGWAPQYAGIEGFRRGLTETIEWFSDPSNLSHYKAQMYNV